MGWVMAPPVRGMSAPLGANGSMPQNARRFPGTFGLPGPRMQRTGMCRRLTSRSKVEPGLPLSCWPLGARKRGTMGALRDSFRRLLRAEGQTRSAKTVEVFGWLILVEGGLILLAPHFVEWVLDLPALGEQGERYLRLLGLFVGGVGMLYVVSGRMNAEGFVFASLIDRPLVPVVMAILWHLSIVPGTLALAFAIQDFGSFLWTLTAWLSEHRPSAAAVLERANTFSDDLDSPSIRAMQAIYSAAIFEEIKMFQVVDRLAVLFRTGLLPLGRGEAVDRLRQYAVTAPRRLPESERRAVYQRSLGI